MGLYDAPYSLDWYVELARKRRINYTDGTANATTSFYMGTVGEGDDVECRTRIPTAFNGSTPAMNLVAVNSAGSVIATILADAAIACTVASATTGTAAIGYWHASADADLFLKFARPASGDSTGIADVVVKHVSDAGTDSVLGGDTLD